MPREIAPSAIALGALVKFYFEATGGILQSHEEVIMASKEQPPHIRIAIQTLNELFLFMVDKDRATKQGNEDPLLPEEADRIPKEIYQQDTKGLVTQSIIAYTIRYLPEEARRGHNRWIKHRLGMEPVHEQTDLPTEITQTAEAIHETLEFYYQAEAEDATTLALISEFYKKGTAGTKKDERAALHWALKAAKRGHPESQFNVGIGYFHGQGLAKENKEKAAYWFQRAAEQGQPNAQHALGYCHWQGEGAKQSLKEAYYWMSKAADQEHPEAQQWIDLAHKDGIGVREDTDQETKDRLQTLISELPDTDSDSNEPPTEH